MAVVLIAVVLVLAVAGAIAFAIKSRSEESAAAEAAGTGPNEFLQEPPTSFPITAPTPVVVIDTPDETATNTPTDEVDAAAPADDAAPPPAEPDEPAAEPADPVDALAPVEPVDDEIELVEESADEITRPVGDDVVPQDVEDDEDDDDEVVVSRFRAPGARSAANPDLLKPMAAARPVFHLEGDPVVEAHEPAEPDESEASGVEVATDLPGDDEPEAGVEFDAPAEVRAEDEATTEITPVEAIDVEPIEVEVIDADGSEPIGSEAADVEPAIAAAIDDPVAVELDDELVIDLADAPAPVDVPDGAGADWADAALEAEPDAVDHVLQALITRARFTQVGVEEVATELVERADLRGQEVSEVLAELVGRADDAAAEADRTSELTLFNDEVPSRPGQLTDFALLAPAEKKRIIIRVLCLLVARSEDQQLPPREEATDAAAPKSWPLARAVWPLATDGDDDGQLPSRRLAKSG